MGSMFTIQDVTAQDTLIQQSFSVTPLFSFQKGWGSIMVN